METWRVELTVDFERSMTAALNSSFGDALMVVFDAYMGVVSLSTTRLELCVSVSAEGHLEAIDFVTRLAIATIEKAEAVPFTVSSVFAGKAFLLDDEGRKSTFRGRMEYVESAASGFRVGIWMTLSY